MEMGLALYKIADTLQVDLTYASGKISGSRQMTVTTTQGMKIPMKVKAVKLFANDTMGVLAHILGDLSVVVSYYEKTGVVSIYLIDGGNMAMDGVKSPPELFISKSYSLRQVMDAIRPFVVGAFVWKQHQWKPLEMPK